MHTARLTPRWVLALLMVISVILPASAREKTDVVILKNGDRITCEIKNLSRGMLTVKTDSMSTVEIKWQDVDTITSKHLFTVQDARGAFMSAACSLPLKSSAWTSQIRRQQATWTIWLSCKFRNWEAAAGGVFPALRISPTLLPKPATSRSSTFPEISCITRKDTQAQLNYSSTLGKSEGETDADRKLLTVAGTRQFSGKWLAYTQAGYEHNLELQLDRRFSLLAGPGYTIAHSNRSQVMVVAAASFSRENYSGEDVTRNLEGFFAIDTQFFKLYSPKFDIVNQFAYLPNFSTRGRRRLQYSSKLRLELIKDFFVSLTFYDSYDSKPPSETASKNDYGFTTGISWSFRR